MSTVRFWILAIVPPVLVAIMLSLVAARDPQIATSVMAVGIAALFGSVWWMALTLIPFSRRTMKV